MHQRGIKVFHVMQGHRAKDQIETIPVGESHQVSHDIANVRARSLPAGDIDQWLADVDADDVIKTLTERLRVASCATAGIQGPATMSRQLCDQPAHDARRLQSGEPIVVSSEPIERLRVRHVPTLAVARAGANPDNRGLSLSISPEPFDSPEAQRLIAALDAGLAELYPPEQRFGPNLQAQHLADGRGTFLVAREDGRAVGCGAIRLTDAVTAEVKRMYVEPDQRGRGVGRAVLARLESAAQQMGARRLVLETGSYSADALALYGGAGFTQVDCWGEYATSPTSICLEKEL
jgi:putative acetyltransferase